ncbi:MAG: amino acid permease [Chitinophagales bacterium]
MKSLFRKKDVARIVADAEAGYGDGEAGNTLQRSLTVRDLTALGIAAVVGAGIFSTIGKASYDGGPGIIFLFIFVAVACGFSALCYAEFASMVPVSGSAYTYSYVAFGEIIAWIIGWDLLMEYAIGNIVVAISWSDYFTTLLHGLGIDIPAWLTMDYFTAEKGATAAAELAWQTAPQIFGWHFICDAPAFLIVAIITAITYIGIKESKHSANIMVALKLSVIFLVIFVGAFYVTPQNWSPFLPNKIGGVLKGISSVFFAYIGFDAISTTAEECKDPQRDLPRGMMYALAICTVIYVVIALVLTGMVKYDQLNVGEPLAFVFDRVGLHWMAGVIAISAVIATASVLLVFQVGQPRIWMSMSRDGLLPPIFARIHPKFGTPSFSTLLTGVVVAVPALFVNMDLMVDLTSIGTLFAFALVAAGILILETQPERPQPKFKTPYINAKYLYPFSFLMVLAVWFIGFPDYFYTYFGLQQGFVFQNIRQVLPHYGFIALCTTLAFYSWKKNLSLLPLLGLLSCAYLLSESGATNWERFAIWLIIGLVCYFLYGKSHSKLALEPELEERK